MAHKKSVGAMLVLRRKLIKGKGLGLTEFGIWRTAVIGVGCTTIIGDTIVGDTIVGAKIVIV
jgi:hypothetical protein